MRPYAALLLGVLAVSTGAIFVKLCDLNPISVGAYRLTLALPLFWAWAGLAEPGWWRRLEKKQLSMLGLSGVFLGLHFGTWIASLSFTTVTSSVVLVTTNPIFVGIGSVLFLKEKVTLRLWVGTLVAFGGTVLVATGSEHSLQAAPHPALGNALALAGAVFMSGYLLVGRKMSAQLPTICYVTAVYSVAACTLWLAVLFSGAPSSGFSGEQWLLLALMALVPQGLGHTLINRSLKRLSTAVVAVAILGEPVFATMLAVPILAEWPAPLQVAGGLVVIFGVGLATIKRPNDKFVSI